MKHVNEEMPDVQKRRLETSSALASVVERSTQKDVKKRYPDMQAMLRDLEGALEVEIARAGGSESGEATAVLRSVPERRRRFLTRRRISVAGILLVLLAGGVAVAIALTTGDEGPSRQPGPGGTAQIQITGANDFDPTSDGGDDSEHPELVSRSIDGNPTGTEWTTETYQSGPVLSDAYGKDGVGIYVQTSKPVVAKDMVVQTTTPGWSGEVYAAASGPPNDLPGWGELVGAVDGANPQQTIPLHVSTPSRYYLLWITTLSQLDVGGYGVAISDINLTG